MSEPIKPALTAEEWVIRLNGRYVEGAAYIERDTGSLNVTFDASAECQDVPQEERHALAALALYNQPFGFNSFHPALCRTVADTLDGVGEDERGEELRHLADRIEALLPPEKG